MARESFRFAHSLRVRWSEVDPQGIVFNAHYLTYFDVAVTEYWRAIGSPYPSAFLTAGVDTFAVKATVEFHRPAGFDDVVEVLVRVDKLGRTSLRLLLEVHRGGDHLISGELVYVLASREARTPTPIPEPLRASVLAFELTPPEQGSRSPE